jgi:hypothetical protein
MYKLVEMYFESDYFVNLYRYQIYIHTANLIFFKWHGG